MNGKMWSMQSILVYDGTCGICTLLVQIATKLDKYQRLMCIPYQIPKALLLTSVDATMGNKSAYTLYNGKLVKGAQAIFTAMSLLPGIYGAMGHVLRKSYFSSLVEPIYLLIAHYRGFISLLFGLQQCEVHKDH